MSATESKPSTLGARLNLLALAILVIGYCGAAGIWIAQDRTDRKTAAQTPGDSEELPTLDSRKAVRDIEMNYGRSGVLAEEFTEWLASLAHGKRLAWTVAVFSTVLAGGCFFAAARVIPFLGESDEPE
jgi:hypothetical protein